MDRGTIHIVHAAYHLLTAPGQLMQQLGWRPSFKVRSDRTAAEKPVRSPNLDRKPRHITLGFLGTESDSTGSNGR